MALKQVAGAAILTLVFEASAQRPAPMKEQPDRETRERNTLEHEGAEPSPSSRIDRVRPEQPGRPATHAPQRDPALARCEGFRAKLEALMRDESAHGSTEETRAQRQSISQERLRAGC